MKTRIKRVLAIAGIALISFAGGKDKITFKEKVESYDEVKVFFTLKEEIIDRSDENKLQQLSPPQKTKIRTSMPLEFAGPDIQEKVVSILNEGMQVNRFVLGDASILPKNEDSKYNYHDLSKLPDGFYAIVEINGVYTRFLDRKEVDGKSVFKASNRMGITSHLIFYEISGGKIKAYLSKMGALMGHADATGTETTKLENLEYMESHFPALPLLDAYKSTMFEYMSDFAKRQLKKHNKAVAKRK